MRFVNCTHQEHAAALLDILNDAIITSTALYDYRPRTLESMAPWFAAKEARRFPVIGAVDGSGTLLGFASYGRFRDWPAYKYTVEHSLYVRRNHRGNGIGKALLRRLIELAGAAEYHVMIGGIDADNAASIGLHTKLGFVHAGRIRHAGFKFGRWLDLAFYQLTLETPARPVDG